MDRTMISDLAHAEHPVASPLDDETVDRLLRLALDDQRSVLDLGCGDGTWLLRALRRDRRLRAVGVDISGAGFDRVQAEAEQAGLGGGLELHQADAQEWTSPERFDVVISIGATHAFGGLIPTLAAAGRHLRPGGRLLVGECFWEQAPNEEMLSLLGAEPEDYEDLAGTVAAVTAAGWVPLHGHVSSLQEWDAYEWSWTGSLTRWATDHPQHPDSAEVLAVATEHRRVWLEGYRGTLGFLTLLLAPRPADLHQ